ncbi:hypothetical protein [Georgenia sp. SUBG003]|uniref:hypothetical protein n=1 Tax=Georgenia sp. SUBG003 TaxID=1497974 RepID=UPI003AB1ACC1
MIEQRVHRSRGSLKRCHVRGRREGEFSALAQLAGREAGRVPPHHRLSRDVRPDAAGLRQHPQLHHPRAGYLQTVFYSLIQPGKNRFNSAFCVGTNVVSREAIAEIGGMYTGRSPRTCGRR